MTPGATRFTTTTAMTRTHLALVGLVCIVTTSGCAGLGLPSGPLGGTEHAHDGGDIDVSVDGHVEPGAEATVVATHHGDPVANASVYRLADGDRELVGRTGDDGRLDVTVPADGNLTVVVESGDLSGRYPPADHDEHHDDGDHTETDHHDE